MQDEAPPVMRTTLYSVLCTAIRLGAVLMAVQVLAQLPGVVVAAHELEEFRGATLLVVVGTFGVLLLALAFWLWPGGLARLAAARSAHHVIEGTLDLEQIQYLALSVLGMWFAMNGLVDIAGAVPRALLLAHADDPGIASMRPSALASFGGSAVKVALGIGLVLGARGLVRALHRLRYAGLPPVGDSPVVATSAEEDKP